MGLWTRRQENNGAPSPFNWGWTPPWAGMCGPRQTHAAPQPTSGNRAFDEYRSETLRRLEDEQHEFSDFLDRLRVAKDKSEFDQFMSDRRQRTSRPPVPPAGTGDHPDANPERN